MSETNINLSASDLSSAIQRGCNYIEVMQWPGGFWIDFELFVGMSSQWVTAYVAHCLAEAKPASPAISLAREWLLKTELTEGGWGFNRDIPPDADSTANVLFLFSRYERERISADVLYKISHTLLAYQSSSDGGFATYLPRPHRPGKTPTPFIYSGSGWCISHLSVTALAALALSTVMDVRPAEDGGSLDLKRIQVAAEFVRKSQNPAGYWEDHWWYDLVYGTYWASRFLLHMGDDETPRRALDWVVGARIGAAWGNGLGGSPSAFHTALALATLMLRRTNPEVREIIENGVNWLLENQLADGSWPSVPILLTPIPEILDPRKSVDASCHQAVSDQNRQFTTATVLLALSQI
jgi:squalene cyclase